MRADRRTNAQTHNPRSPGKPGEFVRASSFASRVCEFVRLCVARVGGRTKPAGLHHAAGGSDTSRTRSRQVAVLLASILGMAVCCAGGFVQ